MSCGIPDQGATGLDWRVQPFMWIERNRIGAFNAGNTIGIRRGDGDQSADATIDMKPEVFVFRQIRESM